MIQTRTSETFVATRQPVKRLGVRRLARPLADANVAAGRDRGLSARTCVPHAHPGEATSDACFRWTAGPDTRLLLIAVVSLEGMLFFDSRALQTWQVRSLCDGLVLTCRSLARHPSIHQSIAGERGEMAMGVRRGAGRQINKYDYGSRAWGGVAGTNTRHAILSTSYMTQDMRCSNQIDT
jgi:hypothetical protein